MSKPKPCRYERTLGYRAVKGEHADDCTDPTTHRGCVECTHPHCGVCGRAHLEDQHPMTCPGCVGSVREDLGEIGDLCRQLRPQAVDAEGLAWASARIPGATAMVLMGPQVDPGQVPHDAEYRKTHRPSDPLPPLTVLARWQELWADWLGVTPAGAPLHPGLAKALDAQRNSRASWLGIPTGDRATITRAIGFLDRHLTNIAQTRPGWVDGNLVAPPEFSEFATQIGKMRAQLEHVLHDESEDEAGIACFECGHQLVRRIRDPKRCRHKTDARRALAERMHDRVDPAAWLEVLRGYGIPAWDHEIEEARLPTPVEIAAARLPCERCDQGGVTDPTPGISWECPSCRMRYTPGEYANAVRRDLADRRLIAGDDVEISSVQSYGWTDITLAADAATTLVGFPVYTTTLRKWVEREKVSACCAWSYDELPNGDLVPHPWGQRLVFWPDVADEANAARDRAIAAAVARAKKAVRDAAKAQLKEFADAGIDLPEETEKELLGALPVTDRGDLDVDAFKVVVRAEVLDERVLSAASARISA